MEARKVEGKERRDDLMKSEGRPKEQRKGISRREEKRESENTGNETLHVILFYHVHV